jgi:hypothetical protein
VLTDEEAREIEVGRRTGVSGPVLGKWVDALLDDRRERVAHANYVRQRIRQALTYFDSLIGHTRKSRDQPQKGGVPR